MNALLDRLRAGVATVARGISLRWYWELRAKDIDRRWGNIRHDHELLARLLRSCDARSVLDLGCGTGRLFPIYLACGVHRVTGQDVSAWALARARARFPQPLFRLVRTPIAQLHLSGERFDVCIANRVLSAVPPRELPAALRAIAATCRYLYLNEFTSAEPGSPSSYWFQHDYGLHLGEHCELTLLEHGECQGTHFMFYRIEPKQGPESR